MSGIALAVALGLHGQPAFPARNPPIVIAESEALLTSRNVGIGKDGGSDVVAALPGYLRGLAFNGDIAIVGLCKIREKRGFGGVPIEAGNTEPVCGLALVDSGAGSVVGLFEFTAGVEEIHEIRVMAYGILQPDLLDAEPELGNEAFTTPEFAYWIGAAS